MGEIVEERGQGVSLEKEQGKPEAISRLDVGIKIIRSQTVDLGQPGMLPAMQMPEGPEESIAQSPTPRAQGLRGLSSSLHLLLQKAGGLVFKILIPPTLLHA